MIKINEGATELMTPILALPGWLFPDFILLLAVTFKFLNSMVCGCPAYLVKTRGRFTCQQSLA